jgi:hypothetical protein
LNLFRKITAVIPCFPYARQAENTCSVGHSLNARETEEPIGASFHSLENMDCKAASNQKDSPLAFENLAIDATAKTSALTNTPEAKKTLPPPQSPSITLEHARKRLSSISTSQPNIAITSLTPPRLVKPVSDSTIFLTKI